MRGGSARQGGDDGPRDYEKQGTRSVGFVPDRARLEAGFFRVLKGRRSKDRYLDCCLYPAPASNHRLSRERVR